MATGRQPRQQFARGAIREGRSGIILVSTLLALVLLSSLIVLAQSRSGAQARTLARLAAQHLDRIKEDTARAFLLPLAGEAIMVAIEEGRPVDGIMVQTLWENDAFEARLSTTSNRRKVGFEVGRSGTHG